MTFTYYSWRFIGFLMNVFDTIDKKVHEAFAKSSMSLHMNSVEREDCRTTGREHVKLPYAKETVP